MISKIVLTQDNKILSKTNTTWVQGTQGNNIYLYVSDSTISLVELVVVKPGGIVSESIKFLNSSDEEGNSCWMAPDGIPANLFNFTIYTGTTAQAMFSFKLHSETDLLDFKYKLTVDIPFIIQKSGAALSSEVEDNETQQWRSIGRNSNAIVETNEDLTEHKEDVSMDVHDIGTKLDETVIRANDAAFAYTDDEVAGLKEYTDDEIEDLKEYSDDEDSALDTAKVDKITGESTYEKVYVKTAAGTQSGVDASDTSVNSTYVKRDGSGRYEAEAPASGKQVANYTWTGSQISSHDSSETAHLFLREWLGDLDAEIARLDSRGKSYGEINILQSTLLATAESTRNTNINADIAARFTGYTPASGDLVYSLESDTENTHEWEYSGTTWVDNGAWTINKATNSIYGLIKGDSTYLSIVAGLVQVLKADYATNIGASGTSYNYSQLTALLADRYTKAEIDAFINNLKTIYGWVEETVGTLTSASATISKETLDAYDLIILQFMDDSENKVFTDSFKPSVLGSGDALLTGAGISLSHNGTTYTASSLAEGDTITIIGITMTSEIDAQLDHIEEKNGEQDKRINELEEAFRKNSDDKIAGTASGDNIISLGSSASNAPLTVKIDGDQFIPTANLVTNGDFSNGLTGWTGTSGDTFTDMTGYAKLTAASTGTRGLYQNSKLVSGVKYYAFCKIRPSVNVTQTEIFGVLSSESITANQWNYYSSVGTASSTAARIYVSVGIGNYFEIDDIMFFNVTNLINAYKYSPLYNKTFAAMSNAEIKAQMDLWVYNGILTVASSTEYKLTSMNKRVRSVGKNLFNNDMLIEYNAGGNVVSVLKTSPSNFTVTITSLAEDKKALNMIFKPNTRYTLSGSVIEGSDTNCRFRIHYTDGSTSDPFVPTSTLTAFTFTTTAGKSIKEICWRFLTTGWTRVENLQIEEATAASAYEPYKSTDLYLQANKVGYKLPNGVCDTIEVRNGKYYYVQRAKTFIPTSVTRTTGTYISRYYIYVGADHGITASSDGSATADGWVNLNSSTWDVEGNENKVYFASNGYAYFLYTKDAEVQTVLDLIAARNTIIYYQLATPVETEIQGFGIPYSNQYGTVYVDDVVVDADVYRTSAIVTNSDYTIDSLLELKKINSDGSETVLNPATAVIAENKLSFTHASLTEQDVVWFTYKPEGDFFNSLTTISYLGNLNLATLQEAWTSATLTNSWTNLSGLVTRYKKDSLGTVWCEVFVTNGTSSSTIFTLPTGYRPTQALMFVGYASGIAAVVVNTTGTVQHYAGTNTNQHRYVFSFRTD